MASQPAAATSAPSLVRALGVADLTWLYLVAVVNLNVVPVVAAEGFRTIWLWVVAVLFFFVPQGIAVVELAEHLPGEGGLYLWAKETCGDFHGFLCGWCYWIVNMFFVPTLLFYLAGITAYFGGSAAALGENRIFFFLLTITLLWLTIYANIHGLGVGKWITNVGGVGALTIAGVLMLLAAIVLLTHRSALQWSDVAPGNFSTLPVATIGIVCFGLVGLELGPLMGDELRDPRRTVSRAVAWGGVLCAIGYVGSTMSLLVAVPKSKMAVVQGLLQAIDSMSAGFGLHWMLFPLALLLTAAIIGSTSAWVSGSARVLFVCGLDRYLPKALGNVHPRYKSPYIALLMFGVLASAIISMSFIGATVKEAYVTLLDLSVALQMISYLYVFLALFLVAYSRKPLFFRRSVLFFAALVGGGMSLLGLGMAFVPSHQITSVASFEWKMVVTMVFFLALAAGLFFYYSRIRPAVANHGIITE